MNKVPKPTKATKATQKQDWLVATFIMPFLDFYCGTEDHLGSTRMVLDEDGGIKEALMYQPYGKVSDVAGISGAMPDPLREKFTGKEYDKDGEDAANGVAGIEAYHFGFRMYDPEVGVWNRPDPIKQFRYAYSYCGSDPLNFTDPFGMEVDSSTYGENTNFAKASKAAEKSWQLQKKLEAAVKNKRYTYSDAFFKDWDKPEYDEYLATVMKYEDGGIHGAYDAASYIDLAANTVPGLQFAAPFTKPVKYSLMFTRDIYDSYTDADYAMGQWAIDLSFTFFSELIGFGFKGLPVEQAKQTSVKGMKVGIKAATFIVKKVSGSNLTKD